MLLGKDLERMKVKEYIKHLATEVKKICDKYNIPTSINLEKYKKEVE